MLAVLPASAWNRHAAAHLALRAGFGTRSPAELDALLHLGLAGAVETFVSPAVEDIKPPALDLTPGHFAVLGVQIRDTLDPEVKRTLQQQRRQEANRQIRELTRWWIEQMAQTSTPLVEKMTLFWHGHFATSMEKVQSPFKMWFQNQTFRRHALGNFRDLTKAVSRDPAMLVWLDLNGSHKEKPNENFARELMELFTLGEGHYSEDDVRAAARAFTGYRIYPVDESFRFVPAQFDNGPKTFLGETGPWDGDAVIDLILKQPACARFLVTKLWRFFASENPPPALIDRLADEFRRNNFELRPLLRVMFRSTEFYSAASRNQQIKSPVQWLAQLCRTLPVEVPNAEILANALRQLGQLPFYPPNVKGWDGGMAWINTGTLTFRYSFGRQLILGRPGRPARIPGLMADGPPGGLMMAMGEGAKPETMQSPVPAVNDSRVIAPLSLPALVTDQERREPAALVSNLCRRLCPDQPQPALEAHCLAWVAGKPLPLSDGAVRELIALMIETPHFQLC